MLALRNQQLSDHARNRLTSPNSQRVARCLIAPTNYATFSVGSCSGRESGEGGRGGLEPLPFRIAMNIHSMKLFNNFN